jgi:two-component system chemotaxis response regulator CheY
MGKILVVDDAKTMRRIIKNSLMKLGFNEADILEAEDGVQAWEVFQQHKDEIDAVLTDWNMPNMNGLELVKKIRQFEQEQGILSKGPQFIKDIKAGKGVKIIMITTEGGKESVIEAVKAGVNNYIVKPFNIQKLKEKLEMIKLI